MHFRVCKLYFHLEDDSLSIVEPSLQNSGMTQGRVVRRHQIPFKQLEGNEGIERNKCENVDIFSNVLGRRFMESKFVTMWDLNIGVDVNIYGKVFKIVDCDHFTRHFLSCQGVTVPSQIPIPPR